MAEDVTGPYDVIVRSEARSVDELGKLVVAKVQARARHHPHPDLPGRPPLTGYASPAAALAAAALLLAGCASHAVPVHPPSPTGAVAGSAPGSATGLPQRLESLHPRGDQPAVAARPRLGLAARSCCPAACPRRPATRPPRRDHGRQRGAVVRAARARRSSIWTAIRPRPAVPVHPVYVAAAGADPLPGARRLPGRPRQAAASPRSPSDRPGWVSAGRCLGGPRRRSAGRPASGSRHRSPPTSAGTSRPG